MKCTSKIFLEHFSEMPSLGMGSSAMPCYFTHNLCQAFSDRKYVKNNSEERFQSPKFQMCIEIIDITCTSLCKDQALGQVDIWSGFWSW